MLDLSQYFLFNVFLKKKIFRLGLESGQYFYPFSSGEALIWSVWTIIVQNQSYLNEIELNIIKQRSKNPRVPIFIQNGP